MVGRKTLIYFVLVLAIAGAAYFWLHRGKNDRQVIRENLRALGSVISIAAEDTRKPLLAKAQEVKKLLGNPCKLSIDEDGLLGSYTPPEIASLIVRFQAQVAEAQLSFHDIKIGFPEKGIATITCTGRLQGITRARESLDEFRELQIEAEKIKGNWKFVDFQTIEALEK